MGLMSGTDWAAMQADLTAVRSDNAVSITIRRGNATLPAQSVRLAGVRSGRIAVSDAASQAEGEVTVLGAPDLDIEIADRFTEAGVLYEVIYLHPNRRAKTQARAKVVQ